jgi:glycosyltransferase involved in cell wall biosynthesis
MIPTYKDIVALRLILNALENQTYKNFEVIVAEDNISKEIKLFLGELDTKLKIKHYQQEDLGNRKALILNKALQNIDSDYIIFIDGDVIPFTTFIESHVKLSSKKTVLCGRRVNLGDKVSKDLRSNKISSLKLEKNYLKNYQYITDDNSRHFEQGIRLSPSSLLLKLINYFDNNIHILGSNFSCFKDDLFYINGFDCDIDGVSKDDVDMEWRFVMSGCRLKSCKFCANLFHLNHKRSSRIESEKIAKVQMEKNKNNGVFRCLNGIQKI